MLDLINVSMTFNPGTPNAKQALSDFSVHLDDGDFVTIIGSNGAGKSTMFNAIAGTFFVDSGSIKLGGLKISISVRARIAPIAIISDAHIITS